MRVIDRFIPAGRRGDFQTLRRGRLLVFGSWGLAAILLAGISLRVSIAEYPPRSLHLGLVCAALFAASPVVLTLSRSLDLAGGVVCLAFFLLLVGPPTFYGGAGMPILMLAPVLPFLTTFLVGPRAGVLVALALVAVILVLVFFPPPDTSGFLDRLSVRELTQVRALVLTVAVLMAGLLAVFAERERREAVGELELQQELYRQLFEQSKDVVVLSTPEGELIDVNQAGVELYGFDSKKKLLARGAVASYADPEERRRLLELLEVEGFVQGYETRHVTRKGETRIIQGTTSTIRDESGRVTQLLAILRDVTENRRLEAERETMLAELERKNAELERFAYTVSHDLKSPLITIQGFLQLVEKDAARGDQERLEQDMEVIVAAVDKMRRLIDDLLELSRIQATAATFVEVSLGAVAREAIGLLAGSIAAAGVRVEIDGELPPARVLGEPTLLRMVFQNLVDNAVKFTTGVPEPRVDLGVRHDADEDVYFVRDNGPGIEPEGLDKVFQLFEKLDADRGGTGIGLATVKRAVEVHGGRVWAESAGQGRGSTFCFTLAPREAAATRDRGAPLKPTR